MREPTVSARRFCPVGGLLSKLRGYLALGFAGIFLLIADPIQRFVISAIVKVFPSKRDAVLGWWQRRMAWGVLFATGVIGGARWTDIPRIPGRAGVLVLMNHQSLMDIPLVVKSLDDRYPRIVTRARYARGKPVISHMARLYQYPLVDPRATKKGHLEGLAQAALQGSTPLVLFPEGTRSKDGEIGRWSRGGLAALLKARSWDVYILVADGFWRAGRLADFVENVSGVRAHLTSAGPFRSPAPGEPFEPFVEEMRSRMIDALDTLREARPA